MFVVTELSLHEGVAFSTQRPAALSGGVVGMMVHVPKMGFVESPAAVTAVPGVVVVALWRSLSPAGEAITALNAPVPPIVVNRTIRPPVATT
jgi:hypothetical protein